MPRSEPGTVALVGGSSSCVLLKVAGFFPSLEPLGRPRRLLMRGDVNQRVLEETYNNLTSEPTLLTEPALCEKRPGPSVQIRLEYRSLTAAGRYPAQLASALQSLL